MMESLSRKSKIGVSVTNSPSMRNQSNSNLYTSSFDTSSQGGMVEGYHVPSSVVMSQGHQLYPKSGREGMSQGHQLYPTSGREGMSQGHQLYPKSGREEAHLHQYEELKVLIPEYGSRKALIYSNGHGNSHHPPSLQQSSQRKREKEEEIHPSLQHSSQRKREKEEEIHPSLQQQQLSSQRRNNDDQISSSLHPGSGRKYTVINIKKNNSPSGGIGASENSGSNLQQNSGSNLQQNSSSNLQHNGIDGKRLNDLRNHLESESRRRRDQHSRKVRNGHQMNNPNNGRNDENMDQSDEEVDYGDEEEEIEAEDEEDGSLNSNQLEMLEKERMRTAAAIAYSRALRQQQQKSSLTLNETGNVFTSSSSPTSKTGHNNSSLHLNGTCSPTLELCQSNGIKTTLSSSSSSGQPSSSLSGQNGQQQLIRETIYGGTINSRLKSGPNNQSTTLMRFTTGSSMNPGGLTNRDHDPSNPDSFYSLYASRNPEYVPPHLLTHHNLRTHHLNHHPASWSIVNSFSHLLDLIIFWKILSFILLLLCIMFMSLLVLYSSDCNCNCEIIDKSLNTNNANPCLYNDEKPQLVFSSTAWPSLQSQQIVPTMSSSSSNNLIPTVPSLSTATSSSSSSSSSGSGKQRTSVGNSSSTTLQLAPLKTDCAPTFCPVLCSGRGSYKKGKCICEPGWKGVECAIRSNDCEVSDCNLKGKCVHGSCHCEAGFKGSHCEMKDCIDPSCSNRGVCFQGECICKPGFRGINCSSPDDRLLKFFPDCSFNGIYDVDSAKCSCFDGYSGHNCSIAKCNLDCGSHGKCIGSTCSCFDGWSGSKCNIKLCESKCNDHGTCSNGTCTCDKGWNGNHCSFNGCPADCSGPSKGHCVQSQPTTTELELSSSSSSITRSNNHYWSRMNGASAFWSCKCLSGWTGVDCSHALESNCADDIDNDHDGLIDCADSECCSRTECKDSLMCLTSPDPLDILLRKPAPSVTASFYHRMKFLIDEGSVQSYAHLDEYSESRVSVIRGRVITPDFNGLTGIRISVATDPQLGFTLTRPDGWFDILVNGGSMITLQFQRSPFHPIKRTVNVPWNEIVVIQTPIIMAAGSDYELNHFYHLTGGRSGSSSSSSVLGTSSSSMTSPDGPHLLHPSFNPGSSDPSLLPDLSYPGYLSFLMVHSNRNRSSTGKNNGEDSSDSCYDPNFTRIKPLNRSKPSSGSSSGSGTGSTIHLQLIDSSTSQISRSGSPILIHIRIIVEGNLFSSILEAEPGLQLTHSWNRRNVYRQKVYGSTIAKIFVGYELMDCPMINWSSMTMKLKGFEVENSDLGLLHINP